MAPLFQQPLFTFSNPSINRITAELILSNDYGNAGDWTTEAGSLVAVSGGVCTNGGAGNNADHRISLTGGITTLSDSEWYCEFDFKYTDNAGVESGTPVYFCDTTVKPLGTVDYLGISALNGGMITAVYKDGAGSRTEGSASSVLVATTQYYCTLIRTLATNLRLEIYTDSGRTSQHGSTINLTVPSSIISLDNLQHAANDNGGTGSGQTTWNIDNINVWNNTTVHP